MARNPAVGRQGPSYWAATIPSERDAGTLRVTQIRSGIGRSDSLRRTLRAIGFRHHQDVVQVRNTAAMRGMLFKVRHLIKVEAAEA